MDSEASMRQVHEMNEYQTSQVPQDESSSGSSGEENDDSNRKSSESRECLATLRSTMLNNARHRSIFFERCRVKVESVWPELMSISGLGSVWPHRGSSLTMDFNNIYSYC